jgi:hypothetical protein
MGRKRKWSGERGSDKKKERGVEKKERVERRTWRREV